MTACAAGCLVKHMTDMSAREAATKSGAKEGGSASCSHKSADPEIGVAFSQHQAGKKMNRKPLETCSDPIPQVSRRHFVAPLRLHRAGWQAVGRSDRTLDSLFAAGCGGHPLRERSCSTFLISTLCVPNVYPLTMCSSSWVKTSNQKAAYSPSNKILHMFCTLLKTRRHAMAHMRFSWRTC